MNETAETVEEMEATVPEVENRHNRAAHAFLDLLFNGQEMVGVERTIVVLGESAETREKMHRMLAQLLANVELGVRVDESMRRKTTAREVAEFIVGDVQKHVRKELAVGLAKFAQELWPETGAK